MQQKEKTPLEELEQEPTEKLVDVPTNLENLGEEDKPENKEVDEKKKEIEAKRTNNNRYSRRIEELNTKYRTTERRALELEEENKRLKDAVAIKKEPDVDDYSDDEKYEADRNQWRSQEKERIKAEAIAEIQQEQAKKQQQANQDKIATNYGKQRLIGEKEYEDFYDSEKRVGEVLQSHGEHAAEVRDSILEAQNSASIINFLDKNPDRLQDIAFLSPREQAKAIWNLDKQLGAKPTKKTSTAPDPIRSERGSAPRQVPSRSSGYDSNKESWKDYCRRRNNM